MDNNIYQRRPSYSIDPNIRMSHVEIAQEGPSFFSTLAAHNREYLGVGGVVARAFDDPTLLLTGNEPIASGIYEWGSSFVASVVAGGNEAATGEYKKLMDEFSEEMIQPLREAMGFTPVEGDYLGILPEFSDKERAEIFIERLNGELTLEGRAALIEMYEQSTLDRATLSKATWYGHLGAMGLSAIWDEQLWADVFITKGVLSGARYASQTNRALKILSASVAATAGAGVTSSVREAILYKGLGTRTPEEVYKNIVWETAFGAIVGGSLATMGVAYRNAVRSRFGEETVPEALDSARGVMMDNIQVSNTLKGKVDMLIESLRAGRKLDGDLVSDDNWNQILDGVNSNVVELIGLRRGTWGNAFLNKFFFFTPNMRLAISKSSEANRIVEMFTDSALVKVGQTAETSLERLKALVDIHATSMRKAQKDMYQQAKDAGANFRADLPVIDSGYDHFDIAVEMFYRRGDDNFDPNITIKGADGSDFAPFKTSDGGALNEIAIKAIKEASKVFGAEQKLFDDMVILAGMVTREQVSQRRAFYKRIHGENFVHRIIDKQAVVQNKAEFLKLLKEGWEDLAEKQRPEMQDAIDNLRRGKQELQEEMSVLEGDEHKAVEAAEELRSARRRLRNHNQRIKELEEMDVFRGDGTVPKVDAPTKKATDVAMKLIFGPSFRAARAMKNEIGGVAVVVRRGGDVHPSVSGIDGLEDGWYIYHLPKGATTTGSDLSVDGVKYYKRYETLKEAKADLDVISKGDSNAVERFIHIFNPKKGDVSTSGMSVDQVRALNDQRYARLQEAYRRREEDAAFITEMERVPGVKEARSKLKTRGDIVNDIDSTIKKKEEELEGMEWDAERAEAVWKGWATPSEIDHLSLVHSDPIMERSLLVADKYVERFLRISAEAQRHNFYNGIGLKVIAFHRLAHGDTIQYARETNKLLAEAETIQRTLRDTTEMSPEDLAKAHNRAIDIEEEISILTETQRMRIDTRLNSSLTKETLQKRLSEITEIGENLTSARKAVREGLDEDGNLPEAIAKDWSEALKAYNEMSVKVGKGKVAGSLEPEGKIRSHRSLHLSTINTPVAVDISALANNRSIHSEVVKWRISRVIDRASEERANGWQVSVGQQQHKAVLLREFNHNIAGNASKKSVKMWNKVKDNAIEDLDIIHQRLFNSWQEIPRNRFWSAATNLTRNYNYSTAMGGVTFSSLPDISMGIFVSGPGPYIAATYKYGLYKFKRLLTNLPPEEKYWVQDLIFAQEMMGTSVKGRAGALASVDSEMAGKRSYSRTDRVEQTSQVLAETTTSLSLLNRWNAFFKSVNSLAAASRISRIAADMSAGKKLDRFWANRRGDERFIRHMRLTEQDLLDIHRLNQKFGSVYENDMGGKFYQTKADNWGETAGVSLRRAQELRAKMTGSVTLAGDMAIITPGVGNVPGMADRTIWARVMLQFKKFFIVATEQLLVPMIQRMAKGDLTAYGTAAGLLVSGAVVTAGKDAMRGRETFPHISGTGGRKKGSTVEEYYSNVVRLALNALDRSGLLAVMGEPWSALESTAYPPSASIIDAVTGVSEEGGLSRAKQKDWVTSALGPTVGKLKEGWWLGNEAIQVMLGDKPLSAKHLSRGRRFAPLQNVLPFTALADAGYSMYDASVAHSKRGMWQRNQTPADFYWRRFKSVEHRIAPALLEVDFSGYDPKRSIMDE